MNSSSFSSQLLFLSKYYTHHPLSGQQLWNQLGRLLKPHPSNSSRLTFLYCIMVTCTPASHRVLEVGDTAGYQENCRIMRSGYWFPWIHLLWLQWSGAVFLDLGPEPLLDSSPLGCRHSFQAGRAVLPSCPSSCGDSKDSLLLAP